MSSSWRDCIPAHHEEFLARLDTDQNGIIVMQNRQESSKEATIKLDIRLYEDGDQKSYLVGLINPYGIAHPDTDVTVIEAGPFKNRLNLEQNTPQYDDHYLGPFNRKQTLMLMGAAEHMATKCDLDEQIAALTKSTNVQNALTKACSEEFNMMCAVERQEKSAKPRGQLRLVVTDGKKGGPGLS